MPKSHGIPIRPAILMLALAMGMLSLFRSTSSFSQGPVDSDGMLRNIEVLASREFEGRLAGSTGNRKAMDLIIQHLASLGIAPASMGDSYEQPFRIIMPNLASRPVFTIGLPGAAPPAAASDNTGQPAAGSRLPLYSFNLYEDYNLLTSMNGGGVDFNGELVLLGTSLYQADRAMIQGRIVVVEFDWILPELVEKVSSLGGKGLLCSSNYSAYRNTPTAELQKSVSVQGRTGDTIFAGYLSKAAYRQLKDLSGEIGSTVIPRVTLSVDMSYPVVETANVLGVLKGKSASDRVLLVSANLDGLGMTPQDTVFGGAIHEASGIAAALELARMLAAQDSLPYRSIVFAFWNGQHQDNAGSAWYLAHPVFPLDKTTYIHLDSIGLPSQKGLQIQADNRESAILKDKFLLHARNLGLSAIGARPSGSIANRFVDREVPSVTLSDISDDGYPFHTVLDLPEHADKAALENAVMTLAGYIGGEYYASPLPDYLRAPEIALIAAMVLAFLFNLFTEYRYTTDPSARMLGTSTESLYFSAPAVLIRRFFARVFPYLVVIFMLAFLVNVRQSTDIRYVNGEAVTNFSLPITMKQTILSLRSLLEMDTGMGQQPGSTMAVIKGFSLKSLALIGSSLGVALTLGLAGGLVESYRSKTLQLRSLGALVLFSVPDVFVVLILLLSYTNAYLAYPALGDMPWLKGFVLPLAALSVIPSIYVSRMTVVAVREELRKDYVRAAKAAGYSRFQLFTTEMMPGVLEKLIDALPTLMAIIFSNMIIVEYLFNYNGIGYFLLYLYKRQDSSRFVPMAIVLGLIYAVFVGGIRQLGRVLHPLHKETLR